MNALNRRHLPATGLTPVSAGIDLRLAAAEANGCTFDPRPDIIQAPKDPQLWPEGAGEFRAKLDAVRPGVVLEGVHMLDEHTPDGAKGQAAYPWGSLAY